MTAPLPAPKRRNEQREWHEQCALFRFLRLNARYYPELGWIYAVTNTNEEGDKGERDRLAGLTKGVWDIHCPIPQIRLLPPVAGRAAPVKRFYPGLYIELKTGTNKLTPDQERFRDEIIIPYGYDYDVSYSWTEAARAILLYLGIEDSRLHDDIRQNIPIKDLLKKKAVKTQ